MQRVVTTFIIIALLGVAIPQTMGSSIAPVGAIANGDFEIGLVPREVDQNFQDTALDTCTGVGHQAIWGTETLQAELVGTTPFQAAGLALEPADRATDDDASNDPPGPTVDRVTDGDPSNDPEPSDVAEPDPEGAADRFVENPEDEALFLAGYGHCVHGDDTGYDAAWIAPAGGQGGRAAFWGGMGLSGSGVSAPSSSEAGFEFDDNPFDREVRVLACSDCSGHNFWQVSNRHVAYTGNFDAFEFRVEAGEISDTGRVVISFSDTPLGTQSPWAAGFVLCELSFPLSAMEATPDENGLVSVDPLDGDFRSLYSSCDDDQALWNDQGTTADEKREMLGQLRIIQTSFWNFHVPPSQASEDCDCAIVIDDVAIVGATTAAEEAAAGNVVVDPSV